MNSTQQVKRAARLMSVPFAALAFMPCLLMLYGLLSVGIMDWRIFYSYWYDNMRTFLNLNPVYIVGVLFYLVILFYSWFYRQDRRAALFIFLYVNIFFNSFSLALLDAMEHSSR